MKIYAAALAALLVGCATVNPKPVPYSDFTTPGLRVYEMRPFVLVQKPFPVSSETLFIDAQISADGRHAKLIGAIPADFAASVQSTAGAPNTLPTRDIRVTRKEAGPGRSAQSGDTPDPADPAAGGKPADDKPAEDKPKDEEGAKDTSPKNPPGSGSVNYQVDLAGTPLMPVNDLYSIVYLPDYNRQFVIDVSSRFGFKKTDIKVGPGGGLLGYNAKVDNSAIIGPLMDVWSALVKSGGAAAEVAINPHGYVLGKIGDKVQAQSGDVVESNNKLAAGSTVTLRLTKINFAIPGPYPMVKPNETFTVPAPTKTDPAATRVLNVNEVAWRSFEVIVAEALFDAPAVVIAGTPSKPAANEDKKPGGEKPASDGSAKPGSATATCDAKGMLASSGAVKEALEKTLREIKKDLKVTASKVSKADGECAAEVEVKAHLGDAVGAPAFKDDDSAVRTEFAKVKKNTKLVFN